MIYLTLVSLIWAFSFSLIKSRLEGIDPALVACLRLTIALPCFLPFLRWNQIPGRLMIRLILTGAVQYGLMYIAYLAAFAYLDAYQVAVYTILTPLHVTLLDNLYQRRFRGRDFAAALLAVAGAAIITYRPTALRGLAAGFLLVQFSNLCFAAGQIEYRHLRPRFAKLIDREASALLFFGGAAVTALGTSISGGWGDLTRISPGTAGTLLYLGVIASGLGFFWWNQGAVRVSTGTLAVFNNLKIPLAVAVALFIFKEDANPIRLTLGGAVIGGGFLLTRREGRGNKRFALGAK